MSENNNFQEHQQNDQDHKIYKFQGEDFTSQFDPNDISQNKVGGGLAYILFFLPLLICPHSAYGRFHANQSLILFIGWVILCVFGGITEHFYVFGLIAFITGFISGFGGLIVFIGIVYGLVNGFSGKAKELPYIGGFRLIK